MSVTIRDYERHEYERHERHERDPRMVCTWINNTEAANAPRLHRLIVGLDIEREPNFYSQNPVATLQLCVGRSCLIYQILHPPSIPAYSATSSRTKTTDSLGLVLIMTRKLWDDYGLQVWNRVDLREWAAEELENEILRNVGLKYLVKEIEGIEVEKPKSVTLVSGVSVGLAMTIYVMPALMLIFLLK